MNKETRSLPGAVDERNRNVVILGAGLAGLAAGRLLSESGARVTVVERESTVGGLSRTVEHRGFRFDLGGHRFFTENKKIEDFVKDALGGDMLDVHRSSKVLIDGAYFDYPWRPANALLHLGTRRAAAILFDFLAERVRRRFRKTEIISLEDWIVDRFGRTFFDIFVEEYSEKVWGVECSRISKDWAERRIEGLSFGIAVRDALFGQHGAKARTLIRKFLYPPLGIGRIAECLRWKIDENNSVLTGTTAVRINHSAARIDGVATRTGDQTTFRPVAELVSSVPLPALARLMNPAPPADVLEAVSRLRFRDLVIVTLMIDRERVTDQTWIYAPQRGIPFGRLHEPTNWSARMAPEGKTLLVTEHFCFRGDDVWTAADKALVEATVASLEGLDLIERREVIDSVVLRIPNAYPVFDIGYNRNCGIIRDYFEEFGNLRLIGRGGQFRYFNMDHAIESGIAAAEEIIAGNPEWRSGGRRAPASAAADQ
jgi:protoporphyrinogen oxidase